MKSKFVFEAKANPRLVSPMSQESCDSDFGNFHTFSIVGTAKRKSAMTFMMSAVAGASRTSQNYIRAYLNSHRKR